MVIIDGYKIDAAVSEGHNFTSEVTSHPVEKGSEVTDHVRLKPVTVTVSGIVSDTPIGVLGDERGPAADRDALSTLGESTASSGSIPSMDAYDRLARIWFARQPVTIETSIQIFGNMILESLSIPRATGDGESLRFNANFRQIKIIASDRTFIDAPEAPTEVATPRSKSKKNKGTIPPKVYTPEEIRRSFSNTRSKETYQSWAKDIGDLF